MWVTFLHALASPFFGLVILLVAMQHYRLSRQKARLMGVPPEPLWVPVLGSVALGLVGGAAGSVLMVLLGVSLSKTGLSYLWLLAMLLMLISPHLICFSYAGGILSLTSLTLGFPPIEVPQLIALVGALHLVESVLIFFSGHLGALPVYLRLPDRGVVGAFNLQRFWPIPLVAGALISVPELPFSAVPMPEWWPLIRPAEVDLERAVYLLLPVAAALGYGDLAISSPPRAKSRRSAAVLLAYSLAVLGLAVGASRWKGLTIPAAAFTPVGHELAIFLGRRLELRGQPRFLPPSEGVMVLDAVWGSEARRWGLTSGSVVRRVNGWPVNSREELAGVLALAGQFLEVEFTDPRGRWRRVQARREPGRPLGLVLVPEPGDPPMVELFSFSPGWLVWRLFKK